MFSEDNKKTFFWIFGIIFSIIVYVLLIKLPIFTNLNKISWLPLLITLILIILFFVVGLFISKIPNFFYLLLGTKNKVNLKEIQSKIEDSETKDKMSVLVKNIKRTISFIIRERFSKEAVKTLVDFIGVEEDVAQSLVRSIKKLRQVRFIYWIVGILLAISNFIIIHTIPTFEFIRSNYIVYSISFVILVLFYLEGYLVTRMPDQFYFNLLKINKNRLLEQKKVIDKKTTKLKTAKQKEEDSINKIKLSIKYLIKMNVDHNWLVDILKEQGFNDKIANKFIDDVKQELEQTPDSVPNLPHNATGPVLKLFLSKVHEEFVSLRSIYDDIKSIKSDISNLKNKQTELESFSKKQIKTESLQSNVVKNAMETDSKKLSKTVNRILLNKGDLSKKEKESQYTKVINFLFTILKPYADKYTKKQIESFLLTEGYGPQVIYDIMEKFKEKDIKFAKKKTKNIGETFVYLVNNLYDKLSKNN